MRRPGPILGFFLLAAAARAARVLSHDHPAFVAVDRGEVESLREWLEARGCANLGRNASGSPISVLRGWVGGFPGARGGQQPACIPTGDAAAGLAFKVREGVSPLLVYAANSVDWYPSQGLSNDTGAQIASLLLAHGADPNEIGPANNTAIAEASARGDVGFVELLLRHGADPWLGRIKALLMAAGGGASLCPPAVDDTRRREARPLLPRQLRTAPPASTSMATWTPTSTSTSPIYVLEPRTGF